MKILRPASAAAALGTTLLLGACFAGHAATPAPAPYTVPSVPPTGSPAPSPKDPASLSPAPPSTVAPPAAPVTPAPVAPPRRPPRYASPRLSVPAGGARDAGACDAATGPRTAAGRSAGAGPRPMAPPPVRVPAGNDHDADNNGGPDDGDGNK